MDNTDIKIINILQKNCKTSTREIGQQVGLTAPAVAERINRLKDSGVISGFHAKINDRLMSSHISAFIWINVPPKEYDGFCRFCEAAPAIIEHHHIVGLNNALLKVRVANSAELESLLEQIRKFAFPTPPFFFPPISPRSPFQSLKPPPGRRLANRKYHWKSCSFL